MTEGKENGWIRYLSHTYTLLYSIILSINGSISYPIYLPTLHTMYTYVTPYINTVRVQVRCLIKYYCICQNGSNIVLLYGNLHRLDLDPWPVAPIYRFISDSSFAASVVSSHLRARAAIDKVCDA